MVLKVGTRSSRLALIQTADSCTRLSKLLSPISFDMVKFDSPGDRDRKSNLQTSPPDFFTRDLDNAVLNGEIDCAIHSAKDLPYPAADGLDWFWLPWHETPHDVLVFGKDNTTSVVKKHAVIGVSSERRERWCREFLDDPVLKPIRGNIETRLKQLDEGKYDAVVMAAAALNRLGLSNRIVLKIALAELQVPAGQGHIAITFKKGDERFLKLRSLFLKPVDIIGAGCGRADLCTVRGVQRLSKAEVVLFDALIDNDLLKYCTADCELISVGKRDNNHSVKQEAINEMLAEYARQGKRVVRLKGGDPAIFGRVTEEINCLDELKLSYRLVPGVSSLNGVSIGAGYLLTGRDIDPGFSVVTPRKKGGDSRSIKHQDTMFFSRIFYMGISEIRSIVTQLLEENFTPNTDIAVVFNGARDDQLVISGTLSNIVARVEEKDTGDRAGLIIAGKAAKRRIFGCYGPLTGLNVAVTASPALQKGARNKIEELGGNMVPLPLISPEIVQGEIKGITHIDDYDWLILSSPAAIDFFFQKIFEMKIDLRSVPKIAVSGEKSRVKVLAYGLIAAFVGSSLDAAADISDFFLKQEQHNSTILRLHSSLAPITFSDRLRKEGFIVDDELLYRINPINYDSQPHFDAILFSSPSTVERFVEEFGSDDLNGKIIVAIGKPTAKTIKHYGLKYLLANDSSMEAMIETLALFQVTNELLNQK